LVEARDRARDLPVARTPPAFFAAARDRVRFVVAVAVPRTFFLGPPAFFVARVGDFEAERFPRLELVRDALLETLSDRDREEAGEVRPSAAVRFEPSSRASRRSSRPAITAPIIMVARSSCLNALPTLVAPRDAAATFRPNMPCLRLPRRPRVARNFDEAATMTVAGPSVTPLVRVVMSLPLHGPVTLGQVVP
jgi:hypothetical protein